MNTAWLIAVDGSGASHNAVDHAIKKAVSRIEKPRILLLNVQTPRSGDIMRFVDGRTVEDFHRETGEAALVLAKQKLAAAGLDHGTQRGGSHDRGVCEREGLQPHRPGIAGFRGRRRPVHGVGRAQGHASLDAARAASEVVV